MKEWTKSLLRNLRDGGLISAREYLQAGSIRKKLPAMVADLVEESAFAIHLLVGTGRVNMGLWMAASWMLATEKRWGFVVYDDGTLTPNDCKNIQSALPEARIIVSAESDVEMSRALAPFPAAWKCRNLHPLCRKLFDIPHYASGSKFLTIDTDILFFRQPLRLLQWLTNDENTTLFLEDVADATLPTALSAASALGREVHRKINTGIVGMHKSAVTLDDLEHCLTNTQIMEEDPWFIEQSLYAVLASLRGGVELLGEDYFMTISGPAPQNAVARHYMGKVRHLFYSEGLPRVRNFAGTQITSESQS